MFSTPPKGESLFVEALEARIAPTGLTGLANNPADSGDARYVSYSTAPTAGTLGFVPASEYGVAGSNVYALKLSGNGTTNSAGQSTGDQLIIYNSATGFNFSSPFIQAVNGNVIAFFQDKNGDGQVQSNELTGIALGKGASIDVNGNVNGDIVTNLSKDGSSITLNSAGKANTSIASIDVLGNITGSIFAGGNINNVTVTGNVDGILAGSAVNGIAYHFGDPSTPTATLAAAPLKDGKVGASIANVTILSVTNNITAGDGGLGASGGSVSGVTFQGDTTGLHIFSGNGGDGNASVRGGPGGNISGILVKGVTDTTPNSLIDIQAGHGGNDPAFKGGKGGSIDSVAVSFDTFDSVAGTQQVSAVLLADNIILQGGAGGAGLKGGQGGNVTDSLLYGSIPDDGVINSDGSANAEIQVLGGAGGAASVSGQGHGGSGGSVTQVTAENMDSDTPAATSSILIQGGDGGAGRDGGNVSSLTLLGRELVINAGNGGDGVASGGLGGSLNTINILNNTLLSAYDLTLNAGSGGAASAGNAGSGGNIATVSMQDSDLASLVINGGTHANGGVGTGGIGGAGGTLSGIQLGDSGSQSLGVFTVRGGVGGDGTLGGGVGGDIGTTQILGFDFSYLLTAGAGGNILSGGKGRAGDGGQLDTVGISDQPFAIVANGAQTLYYTGADGAASAGAGGNGTRGGAGGDVNQVNLLTALDVTLSAGAGGSASTRKPGSGGEISSSVGDSLYGSVTAAAGNAGAAGAKPAAGGGITGLIAAAQNNISITAGNGTFGGAGGSIANSGTNLDDVTQLINTGSVTATAGNGSALNGVAGAGGSISVFSGYIGTSGQTAITAGAGGGGDSATAAGAGGSVDQVKLTGAGVPVTTTTDTGTTTTPVTENPVIVTIDAGDAGSSGQLHRGATGGSVTNVTIYNLAPETTVQHIAAGDGGNALKHGGLGGSISQVNVGAPGDTYADIGFRSGETYGYAVGDAGGLFAGAGGTGSKSGGTAGNVTNITANAISSIVAGKGSTPQLAGTVDSIFLEGLVATVADSTGAFTNFSTANLVGSVIDPTAAGASTYQAGDGLIAAATLTSNRNFIPEALLTLDANGNLELVDYQQPNPNPVVTAG